MTLKRFFIKAELLYDGIRSIPGMTIVIKGDTIVDITASRQRPDVSGIVTPAFIDAHSHIGMERQGEPVAETETDERSTHFAPLVNPVDSIYFDDRAFSEAVDFGVLYSCVLPGSGNILGGQAKVIRNFVKNRDKAVIRDFGFKMALGYNPRSKTEWKGSRPNTRMGTASLLETYFTEVLREEEKARIKKERDLYSLEQEKRLGHLTDQDAGIKKTWIQREYEAALSNEQKAVLSLLNGKKAVKAHVHKEDDAMFLIGLKHRFNLKMTAEHACGIADTQIFNALAQADIPVVYGPLGSFDYKVELKNASYKNAAALMASQARYGLMTDHPIVLAHHLRESLKYFLIHNMSQDEAISRITRCNAELLGIESRLGTIEEGKLASLIVWNKDPFHLGAFPSLVMAEGDIIRNRP